MPDPITDSTDTRVAAQAGEGVVPSPDVSGTETAEPKKWAEKYDAPEQLEEAYVHLREETTRAEQRAADLARQNQELQNDVLKKLAAAQEAPRYISPEEEEAQLEKLADETGLDKNALLYFGNRLADVQEQSKSVAQAELKALREELAARDEKLQGFIETQDPAYQQNKELVDNMVEAAGLTRQQAMSVLKVVPRGPAVEAGSPSPGSMGSATVTRDSNGNEQSSQDVLNAYLKAVPDATPEEIAIAMKKGVGLQSKSEWQMAGGGE